MNARGVEIENAPSGGAFKVFRCDKHSPPQASPGQFPFVSAARAASPAYVSAGSASSNRKHSIAPISAPIRFG